MSEDPGHNLLAQLQSMQINSNAQPQPSQPQNDGATQGHALLRMLQQGQQSTQPPPGFSHHQSTAPPPGFHNVPPLSGHGLPLPQFHAPPSPPPQQQQQSMYTSSSLWGGPSLFQPAQQQQQQQQPSLFGGGMNGALTMQPPPPPPPPPPPQQQSTLPSMFLGGGYGEPGHPSLSLGLQPQQQPLSSSFLLQSQIQHQQQQQQQQDIGPPPPPPPLPRTIDQQHILHLLKMQAAQHQPQHGQVVTSPTHILTSIMAQQQQKQLQQQSGAAGDPLSPTAASSINRMNNTTDKQQREKPTDSSTTYASREGRWVDFIDWRHDGRPPKTDLNQLSSKLLDLASSLTATAEEKVWHQQTFDQVKQLLLSAFPASKVHLFGSAANGLSVRHSNDLDICLELPFKLNNDDPEARDDILHILTELVTKAMFVDIKPLPKARIPVIKFTIPNTTTSGSSSEQEFPPMRVDVTLNNMLACANTKLLADYCAIDPRLAQLVALVKHWAKRRDVNNPYMGTLSSYCYVLMCIHHLQTRSPPILPVLQEEEPKTFKATIDGWVCDYCDQDLDRFKKGAQENKETIAELLWTFFEYWAWLHDYGDGVATIRTKTKVTKTEKDWTKRVGTERHLLCVEDPFVLSHDLGRTVDWRTKKVLKKELTRAATVLRDLDDPMVELFRPYTASNHHHHHHHTTTHRKSHGGGGGGSRVVHVPLAQLVKAKQST